MEVRGRDGTVLVLDAGNTGIRRLGMQLEPTTTRDRYSSQPSPHGSHTGPGLLWSSFNPLIKVHVWGPASSVHTLEARLARYLSPPLFPVHLRDLPNVVCHEVPCAAFDIGPFRIWSSLICHPGPTVGYRIESEDGIVAYLCDHEPALGLPNGRWPSSDWISGYDIAMDADLLIHDAQYTDEEYERCIGWGHSTYRHAFEFAAQVGARRIVPFHHDPSHDDETLDRLLDHAVAAFKWPGVASPGREGTTFELGEYRGD